MSKEYQNTKSLKDPGLILLNGDSIRLNSSLGIGLMFDKDSKKYYYERTSKNCITDGTNYEGRFKMNNKIQEYNIHSGRISEEDYRLNQIICNLIKSYFSNQDYSILLKEIENDKPVPKKYQ